MILSLILLISCICYASDDEQKPFAQINNFADVINLFSMDNQTIVQKIDNVIAQTSQQIASIIHKDQSERTFNNTIKPMYAIISDNADIRIFHMINNALDLSGQAYEANIRLKNYCIEVENHKELQEAFANYYNHGAPREQLNTQQQEMLKALAHYYAKYVEAQDSGAYVIKKQKVANYHRLFAQNVKNHTWEDNAAIITRLYASNNELAKLKGFDDYATMQLDKEGDVIEKVERFLDEETKRLQAMPLDTPVNIESKQHDGLLDHAQLITLLNAFTIPFGFEWTAESTKESLLHSDIVGATLRNTATKQVVGYLLADMFCRPGKLEKNNFTVRIVSPIIDKDMCKPGLFFAFGNISKDKPYGSGDVRNVARKVAHILGTIAAAHHSHYLINPTFKMQHGPILSALMDYLINNELHLFIKDDISLPSRSTKCSTYAGVLLDARIGLELSRETSFDDVVKKMSDEYGACFTQDEIRRFMLTRIIFTQNNPGTLYKRVEHNIIAADLCRTLKERGTLQSDGLRDLYTQLFIKPSNKAEFKTAVETFLGREPNCDALFASFE